MAAWIGKPSPDSTFPFWRIEPHELDNYRTSQNLPTECDLAMIGAGYVGTVTAYHLYDGNPSPPSIVLLEARQACSGATVRNGRLQSLSYPWEADWHEHQGGHSRPKVYVGMSDYIEKYGLEAAVRDGDGWNSWFSRANCTNYLFWNPNYINYHICENQLLINWFNW